MKNSTIIALVVIAVIGAFAYILHQNAYDANQPQFYVNPVDGMVPPVIEFLKSQLLKDPESYQSIKWFKVEKRKDGNFVVRHRFRAKNPNGEYDDPATLSFVLTPEGKVIQCR